MTQVMTNQPNVGIMKNPSRKPFQGISQAPISQNLILQMLIKANRFKHSCFNLIKVFMELENMVIPILIIKILFILV